MHGSAVAAWHPPRGAGQGSSTTAVPRNPARTATTGGNRWPGLATAASCPGVGSPAPCCAPARGVPLPVAAPASGRDVVTNCASARQQQRELPGGTGPRAAPPAVRAGTGQAADGRTGQQDGSVSRCRLRTGASQVASCVGSPVRGGGSCCVGWGQQRDRPPSLGTGAPNPSSGLVGRRGRSCWDGLPASCHLLRSH